MIGIDFTFINFNMNLTGSLEIFTCDILDCIAEQKQEDNFVLIVHPAVEDAVRRRFPAFKVYGVGGALLKSLYYMFEAGGIGKAKKCGLYDVWLKMHGITKVWFPYMLPQNVQYCRCDYVGTCHDLMQIDADNNDAAYRKMFERAEQIVAISNYTKKQIVANYHIEEKKVVMIPNSIYFSTNDVTVETVPALKGKKFILDCNAFASRKNTLVMIRAFERLKNRISEDLVLCGGYKFDSYFDACKEYIESHGLSNRIHVFVGIDEKQKNWLFENCTIFVTPSENEGFGRTPVEAALFMKPVVSSRATSLEETTCGLVHYIQDPRNDEELADVILEVLQHPDKKEKLLEIKEVFIKKYSPKRVVDEYMKVFCELGWISKVCSEKSRDEKMQMLENGRKL